MKDNSHKGKRAKTGSLVVLVFLLIYVPSLLHWVYGKNISTDIIRIGVLEDSISTQGYIIRDSVLYKSSFDGRFIPEVEDGERIPANSRIATVLKSSSAKLLEMLEDKKLKVIKAQNEKGENLKLFSEDIERLEGEIGKKVRLLIEESNSNSLLKVDKIEDGVHDLIQKKASVISGVSTSDAYINSLKKEMENLQGQLNAGTDDITAEYAGVVSYVVDGYEELLTPKAIRELTPQYLDQVKTEEKKVPAGEKSTTVGKPFAKVIKGNYYYIAVPLKSDEAAFLKADDTVTMRINDVYKEIRCSVVHKSQDISGRCVVVVKADRLMSETSGMRKVSIDLIKNSHEGMVVPRKSLMNMDLNEGKATVVLVKANCARFREVKIEGSSSEFAVISNTGEDGQDGVSLYDTYVIDPENIEEGQIINR